MSWPLLLRRTALNWTGIPPAVHKPPHAANAIMRIAWLRHRNGRIDLICFEVTLKLQAPAAQSGLFVATAPRLCRHARGDISDGEVCWGDGRSHRAFSPSPYLALPLFAQN